MKKTTKKVKATKTNPLAKFSHADIHAEALRRLNESKVKLEAKVKEAKDDEEELDDLWSALDGTYTNGKADTIKIEALEAIENAKQDLETENLEDELENINKLIKEFEMINFI